MPPQARSVDINFQVVQASLLKASTLITHMMDTLSTKMKLLLYSLVAMHWHCLSIWDEKPSNQSFKMSLHIYAPKLCPIQVGYSGTTSPRMLDIKDMERLRQMVKKGANYSNRPFTGTRYPTNPYAMRGRGRGFRQARITWFRPMLNVPKLGKDASMASKIAPCQERQERLIPRVTIDSNDNVIQYFTAGGISNKLHNLQESTSDHMILDIVEHGYKSNLKMIFLLTMKFLNYCCQR